MDASGLKCADLVDAMERLHRPVLDGRRDEASAPPAERLRRALADGRLRDLDELARYEFAAYCSGEATRWGGDHVTPFQANTPVVLGGVGVIPGQ